MDKMLGLEAHPKTSRVTQIHIAQILLIPLKYVLDTVY